eukprot:s2987_g3.t1
MLKRWLDLMQSASASALITKVRAALVVLPSLSFAQRREAHLGTIEPSKGSTNTSRCREVRSLELRDNILCDRKASHHNACGRRRNN